MIHTVKGFVVVNKVDVFLELSSFFNDPTDVGNLISGSSAFSKSNLHIWKFSVHILMKPRLPCYYNIGLIVVPGLPRWLSGKEFACNPGDPSSVSGSERSPGGGHGNPLQYSCLKNPMDGGAWWATVHGVSKSRTSLSDFSFFLSLSLSFSFLCMRQDEWCKMNIKLTWGYSLFKRFSFHLESHLKKNVSTIPSTSKRPNVLKILKGWKQP